MSKYIAIFILGLGLVFSPKILALLPSTPVLPDTNLFTGDFPTPESVEDAHKLGACLKASANLFVIDKARETPYYDTLETLKWSMRRTHENVFGDGVLFKDKYPQATAKMAAFMKQTCGDKPTHEVVVAALNKLGDHLKAVK